MVCLLFCSLFGLLVVVVDFGSYCLTFVCLVDLSVYDCMIDWLVWIRGCFDLCWVLVYVWLGFVFVLVGLLAC